jgi:hypothetical protein
MTKRVQLAGETADIEQFLVGLERELRVDLSNESLRLHDGVKEGGYEFLNRDASDNRYQFHSAELDGFVFGPQEKGIVTRTGPAQYKIRKVISESADIEITNPRGTAGNFDLNLAAIITSIHTWSETQTFQSRIVAEDGIDGDSYGTHHGDVVGNVVGNVEGNAHGDATGSFTGDVDVRGHTILFDDGQIPEGAIDPTALINRGVPLGAIIMWSGTIDTIPESWALCDGSAGTPDLRNQFIMGAGAGLGFSEPFTVGGSATISLAGALAPGGSHTHELDIDGHALTVAELAAHSHLNGIADDVPSRIFTRGSGPCAGGAGFTVKDENLHPTYEGDTETVGAGDPHTHTGATANSGAHSHDLTLDDAPILPPFYALCFIMKTV